MSEIQEEAYTEACEEIDQLKFLNAEERQTIDELSRLCLRAADALETYGWYCAGSVVEDLIAELRKAAE